LVISLTSLPGNSVLLDLLGLLVPRFLEGILLSWSSFLLWSLRVSSFSLFVPLVSLFTILISDSGERVLITLRLSFNHLEGTRQIRSATMTLNTRLC